VALLASIGCSPPASHSIAGSAAPTRGPTAIERAEALERGDRVPRDYQAAAAIYRTACVEGAGDLAACRRLLRAELEARGVDLDRRRAIALAAAMCARDDLTGCLLTGLADRNPSQELVDKYKRLIEQPCDAAHLARCEVPLDPFGFLSQSSSREH